MAFMAMGRSSAEHYTYAQDSPGGGICECERTIITNQVVVWNWYPGKEIPETSTLDVRPS